MPLNELRCPDCGAARFELIGRIVFADRLFLNNPDEACRKCGHRFHEPHANLAA